MINQRLSMDNQLILFILKILNRTIKELIFPAGNIFRDKVKAI